MKTYIRDLIEYEIESIEIPSNVESFKGFNKDRIFELGNEKPDIMEITKVRVKSSKVFSRVVKTAKGISLEGKKYSGLKCITRYEFNIRIEYLPEGSTGTVVAINERILLDTYMMVGENYSVNSNLATNLLIEDCYVETLGERHFALSLSGMVVLEGA